MKLFVITLVALFALDANANVITVKGERVDRLVNALVNLGFDQYGTHEYFQEGVTVCSEMFDVSGNHFPNGKVGDYMGESCLIYGDSSESDRDDALRVEILLPSDDPSMANHPELRQKWQKLKDLRLSLERLVQPLVRTTTVKGKNVVAYRMSGIAGIACDGRDSAGVRVCDIKTTSQCPPK